ncbi:hypothetical protein GCT13_13380 [Paraburkholderia sp. CNPSo 3157]|uniref:Uncharacterized protein n=1 Tax=Paraburkholderia franconis TaxID=2654983 RepID=A0A7X1N9I7_9BURK|nr:hypothetical protein [Paraburkholderia franconis]
MTETSRSECWDRFRVSVRAARSGSNREAKELIEAVRQKHGDVAAEIQRRELRNYVDSEKPA